jgi:hypothetical protein
MLYMFSQIALLRWSLYQYFIQNYHRKCLQIRCKSWWLETNLCCCRFQTQIQLQWKMYVYTFIPPPLWQSQQWGHKITVANKFSSVCVRVHACTDMHVRAYMRERVCSCVHPPVHWCAWVPGMFFQVNEIENVTFSMTRPICTVFHYSNGA